MEEPCGPHTRVIQSRDIVWGTAALLELGLGRPWAVGPQVVHQDDMIKFETGRAARVNGR